MTLKFNGFATERKNKNPVQLSVAKVSLWLPCFLNWPPFVTLFVCLNLAFLVPSQMERTAPSICRLKLGDFGLAMVVTEPVFTICGTPTYVAPEILCETG